MLSTAPSPTMAPLEFQQAAGPRSPPGDIESLVIRSVTFCGGALNGVGVAEVVGAVRSTLSVSVCGVSELPAASTLKKRTVCWPLPPTLNWALNVWHDASAPGVHAALSIA